MNFTFETAYTPASMSVMAKALRKTIRAKHSKRSHRFGFLVLLLGLILMLSAEAVTFRLVLTVVALAAILLALIFEDRINGYFAYKRILPGTQSSIVQFYEDGYHSETAVGTSDFRYDSIVMLAEHKDYFILIFSASHAQLYDKHTLTGGSCEAFKSFISEKTRKEFIAI